MKKMPKILLVDWYDSVSKGSWQDRDDCKAESLVCQSVGFLVDETKDYLCLALNRVTEAGYTPFGQLISIPKVAIKRRVKIKKVL